MWKDRHGCAFGAGDRVRVASGQLDDVSGEDGDWIEEFRKFCPDGWEPWMVGTIGAEGVALKEMDSDSDDEDDRSWCKVKFDRKIGGYISYYYRPEQLELVETPSTAAELQLDRYDQLLEDQAFHDVTFKLANGTELGAHRSILACVSSAFGSMFKPPMLESNGVVNLPDVTKEAMTVLLRLVYSGRVDARDWQSCSSSEVVPLQILLEVLTLARKYVVESVIGVVVEALKDRLRSAAESDLTEFEEIFAAAIRLDAGAVRTAAIEAARESKAIRYRYDAIQLRPEVQFELQGLWPPPCSSDSPAPRKRGRLK